MRTCVCVDAGEVCSACICVTVCTHSCTSAVFVYCVVTYINTVPPLRCQIFDFDCFCVGTDMVTPNYTPAYSNPPPLHVHSHRALTEWVYTYFSEKVIDEGDKYVVLYT